MKASCLVVMWMLALAPACSSGDSARVGAPEVDAARLQELLGSDPARALLSEIERAVDSERPVMAAEMIEQAGVPAIRRQIARLEDAPMATREGRRLRTRAVRIHRARADVLARYGAALARGIDTEDEELLDAMRAYAMAELEIASLYRELEQLHPLRTEQRGAHEAARLESGSPIRPSGDPESATQDHGDSPEHADLRAGEPQEPLPE